jgi:phage terminase small subunit
MKKELTPAAKAKVMASQNPDYITPRQQAFIAHYLSNGGNGTQAAIAAGYARSSASVTASELLAKAKIKKRLTAEKAVEAERLGLDADWITSRLMNMAEQGETHAVRVRALELLGKVVGVYAPDKKQIDATVTDAAFLATIEDDDEPTVQ